MSLIFRAISDKPNLIKFDFLQAEQVDLSARGFAAHRSLFEIDLWASLDLYVCSIYLYLDVICVSFCEVFRV
jgi:hypothetical protein